ncbi:MAG: hypothetical protein ACREIB_00090, partial [Pseudomonadota bacterium]
YLHALKARLDEMLAREGRTYLAAACFAFLPFRAELDLAGWADQDIFQHRARGPTGAGKLYFFDLRRLSAVNPLQCV